MTGAEAGAALAGTGDVTSYFRGQCEDAISRY